MFAVVRHTYQIEIPEPSSLVSRKSTARWIHKVWLFKENNFYQLGRESIAIAEVLDSPTIIYQQDLDELSEKLDDLNDKIEKEITGENNGRDTKKLIH